MPDTKLIVTIFVAVVVFEIMDSRFQLGPRSVAGMVNGALPA